MDSQPLDVLIWVEALHGLNNMILFDFQDISTREHNSGSTELEAETDTWSFQVFHTN